MPSLHTPLSTSQLFVQNLVLDINIHESDIMPIKNLKLNKTLRELETIAGYGIEQEGNFFSNVDYWFHSILNNFGKKYNRDIEIVKLENACGVSEVDVASSTYRTNNAPLFVGDKTSFFPINVYNNDLDKKRVNIPTPPIRFFEIVGGSILLLEQFGPCYFDISGNLIEDLSTPYAKLIFYIDIDLVDLKNNTLRTQSGLVLLDRCLEPNYAHWLLDWMPRTMFKSLEDKLILPTLKTDWQKDMLKYFSSETDYFCLKDNEVTGFSKLKVPSCGGRKVEHPATKGHPKAISFLRSKLTQYPEKGRCFPEVLIIYRKGSRELKNLSQVYECYIEKGASVCIIDCAKVDVAQQWSYFNSAKIIVGMHGAALASAVFMSPGSVLVEIFPKSYGNPAFWIASSGLNISYIPVTDVIEEDIEKKPRERGVSLTKETILSFIDCSLELVDNNAEVFYE